MNSQDIREVVLKINDGDVKKTLENLQKTLEGAEKGMARLEKKKVLTPEEAMDLQKFSTISWRAPRRG